MTNVRYKATRGGRRSSWQRMGPWISATVVASMLFGATHDVTWTACGFVAGFAILCRKPKVPYSPSLQDRQPHETGDTEPTEPLVIPRTTRWLNRFRDRRRARRRQKEAGGFRSTVLPRRCIHCRYELTGLPDYHTCPECGRQYSAPEIDAYYDDPK